MIDKYAILFIGNIGSGKTTIANKLAKKIHPSGMAMTIDRCRVKYGNGKISGEFRAWGEFLSCIEEWDKGIFEFSGTGNNITAVRRVFTTKENDCKKLLIHLKCDKGTCLKRIKKRGSFNIPFPYKIEVDKCIDYMDEKLKETPWLGIIDKFSIDTTKNTPEEAIKKILYKLEEI